MTLKQLQNLFYKSLLKLYPNSEIDTFFYWIVEDALELKRIDVSLNPDFQISQKDFEAIEKQLKRLEQNEPIQHILGYTEFYGLRIKVNKHVLIPRPETEELVDWVVSDHKNKRPKNIIDIGTGSACMAIAVKIALPDCKLSALDVSEKALDVAKENASEHKADLNFIKQDILKSDKLPEDTDVIISNPPYVKYDEKGRMRDNVLNYEPHVALFVKDNDALIFYRKICELAIKASQNVTIYFEINQYLANDLKMMLKDFNIQTYEFRQDFRGNDRMLKLLID